MSAVDAHHHLWDPRVRDYPWMAAPALDPIRRPYGLEDLRVRAAAAGVDRTVLVQTVSDEAETEEFLALASSSGGLVAGVVGWVDLAARAVAEAGLAYDLLGLVPQLEAAVASVRDLPEGRFVLDHAAKPAIAAGEMEPWAGALAELGKLPNVTCKLSGLVTEARWDDWDTERIRPYADHVLASFGPDRVMFGSDWPVCELAASYDRVRALAGELLERLSPTERDAVLQGTATRVYRLA